MSTTTIPTGAETYGQKVWRKLKQEPLIPAFTALTCLALIQASRKMNKGDQTSMNRWLRFRVAAQGATIVALLGYSYVYGFGKFARTEVKHDDNERKKLDAERERERFEGRMREVEEMHRVEMEGGGGARVTVEQLKEQRRMQGMTSTNPPPSHPPPAASPSTPRSSWSSWFGGGK